MKSIQRILACIDKVEHTGFLVEKVLRLKDYAEAHVYFVQFVDDGLEDAQVCISDDERKQALGQLKEISFELCDEAHAIDENWASSPIVTHGQTDAQTPFVPLVPGPPGNISLCFS